MNVLTDSSRHDAAANDDTSLHEETSLQAKKRNRAVLSCLTCHSRRVKCDRKKPCEACKSYGNAESCTYASRPTKRPRKRREVVEDRERTWDQHSSSAEDEDTFEARRKPSLATSSESERSLMEQHHDSTSSSVRVEGNQVIRLRPFSAFVDRFHLHTEFEESDKIGPVWQRAYPYEVLSSIHAARSDLPVPERANSIIIYFMEQLDWLFESGDFDDMEKWMMPFFKRMSQPSLSSEEMVKGDATKLCLLMTMMAASLQSASEGLIRVYFLESTPCGFNQSTLNRSIVKQVYERHIKTLLEVATNHDGASAELVRCNLNYMHFLKNEGRHGDTGARPLMTSLSGIVRQSKLHIDPPASMYTDLERESRRRLFWTYYNFDRMTAAHIGLEIKIRDEDITTKEPSEETWSSLLGRRNHLTMIHRIKMSKIAGQLAAMLQSNNTSAKTIEAIEENFQKIEDAFPPELHSSLPPLELKLRQFRTFDLQRHLLQVVFDSMRGSLHRLCFFPSETIPMDRVIKSRKICIQSAMNMIRVQESLRMRVANEHHLRCFYVPYFLLESSITLILGSLIELGNVPSGKEMPKNIKDYMQWSHRALDILNSIPADFTPATQGARLLSRVLAKAIQIIDLHAHHKLTPTDSSTAIRQVLCDEEGRRVQIPFLEISAGQYASENQKQCNKASTSSIDTPSNKSTVSTNGGHSDACTSLTTPPEQHISSNNTTNDFAFPSNLSNSFYSTEFDATTPSRMAAGSTITNSSSSKGPTEPTYADFGIDFFNNLAGAVPNPFITDNEIQESQQQAAQQAFSNPLLAQQTSLNPPQSQTNNIDLDDQMDIWLASLQNFA